MKGVQVLRTDPLKVFLSALAMLTRSRTYNNIVAPDSQLGEVTIDTHAVAAAVFNSFSKGI